MREAVSPEDRLRHALKLADRGWPVFPVQPLDAPRPKAPYSGFMEWERRATTNAEVLAAWWLIDFPDALPAIAPGRVARVVIDVDRHPDGPDGFASLVRAGVNIPRSVQRYPSVSGSGFHAYFRGSASSRNGLYPGVDRKASGGYVVANYDLAPVAEIGTKITRALQGRTAGDERHPYDGPAGEWLAAHAGFPPSAAVRAIIEHAADHLTGYGAMLRVQARMVALGREGHGGVPEGLAALHRVWTATEHRSGHPDAEWSIGLYGTPGSPGAIAKFGGSTSDVAES